VKNDNAEYSQRFKKAEVDILVASLTLANVTPSKPFNRKIQRGSSNLYFAGANSALPLPKVTNVMLDALSNINQGATTTVSMTFGGNCYYLFMYA